MRGSGFRPTEVGKEGGGVRAVVGSAESVFTIIGMSAVIKILLVLAIYLLLVALTEGRWSRGFGSPESRAREPLARGKARRSGRVA